MIDILCHFANTLSIAKTFNIFDVFSGQLEIENIDVIDDSFLGDRFWNWNVSDFDLITKIKDKFDSSTLMKKKNDLPNQDLSRSFLILFSDFQKLFFLHQNTIIRCCPRAT